MSFHQAIREIKQFIQPMTGSNNWFIFASFLEQEVSNLVDSTSSQSIQTASTLLPSCSDTPETLYSVISKQRDIRDIMPTSTMETHTIPSKCEMMCVHLSEFVCDFKSFTFSGGGHFPSLIKLRTKITIYSE